MNGDNGFPKFQYSVFVGPGRNEQYVVRGNDFEEVQKDIAKVKGAIGEQVEDIAENVVCPIHKVALRHFVKDGEEWWSHQLPDGGWCNGRDTKYNRSKNV